MTRLQSAVYRPGSMRTNCQNSLHWPHMWGGKKSPPDISIMHHLLSEGLLLFPSFWQHFQARAPALLPYFCTLQRPRTIQSLDKLNRWPLPSSAEGLRKEKKKARDPLVQLGRRASLVLYSKGLLPAGLSTPAAREENVSHPHLIQARLGWLTTGLLSPWTGRMVPGRSPGPLQGRPVSWTDCLLGHSVSCKDKLWQASMGAGQWYPEPVGEPRGKGPSPQSLWALGEHHSALLRPDATPKLSSHRTVSPPTGHQCPLKCREGSVSAPLGAYNLGRPREERSGTVKPLEEWAGVQVGHPARAERSARQTPSILWHPHALSDGSDTHLQPLRPHRCCAECACIWQNTTQYPPHLPPCTTSPPLPPGHLQTRVTFLSASRRRAHWTLRRQGHGLGRQLLPWGSLGPWASLTTCPCPQRCLLATFFV